MGRQTTLLMVCFVAGFLWTQQLLRGVAVADPAPVSLLAIGLEWFSSAVQRAATILIWILRDARLRSQYVKHVRALESKAKASLIDEELSTVKQVAESAVAARNRLVETTREKTSPLGLGFAKLHKGTLPDFENVRDNLVFDDYPGRDFESLATTEKIKVYHAIIGSATRPHLGFTMMLEAGEKLSGWFMVAAVLASAILVLTSDRWTSELIRQLGKWGASWCGTILAAYVGAADKPWSKVACAIVGGNMAISVVTRALPTA